MMAIKDLFGSALLPGPTYAMKMMPSCFSTEYVCATQILILITTGYHCWYGDFKALKLLG